MTTQIDIADVIAQLRKVRMLLDMPSSWTVSTHERRTTIRGWIDDALRSADQPRPDWYAIGTELEVVASQAQGKLTKRLQQHLEAIAKDLVTVPARAIKE